MTTSYFTGACQREVLHDAYPVELVHGLRLIGMLRANGMVSAGKVNIGDT